MVRVYKSMQAERFAAICCRFLLCRTPAFFWHLHCAQYLVATGVIQHVIGRTTMIRKLKSGEYRLYSRKKDPRTGKRRNLGTFGSRAAAEKHERAVQFFKRH